MKCCHFDYIFVSWKLSYRQLQEHLLTNILSKWQHLCFSVFPDSHRYFIQNHSPSVTKFRGCKKWAKLMWVMQPTVGRSLFRNEKTFYKCISCSILVAFFRQICTHRHMSTKSIYKRCLGSIFVFFNNSISEDYVKRCLANVCQVLGHKNLIKFFPINSPSRA